jgi:cytochrome c peroxidase
MTKTFLGFILLLFLFSCSAETEKTYDNSEDTSFIIKENSAGKIALGKKLFFDKNLSKNKNVSCSSCHKPEFAFADNLPVSIGTNAALGFRNSPSIIGMGNKSLFHTDGGVRTLELQTMVPIIDSNEIGGNFIEIVGYLQSDKEYIQLFQLAFDSIPSIFGMTRAISAYEKSLIHDNSAYDDYINGDSNALSHSQKRGLQLFNSTRLGCLECHSGVNQSDYSFQNIGLEHQVIDSGRARITLLSEDAGKFAVPSLRNVSLTAPYMHNGSFNSLEEVILYLENGGGTHPNKSKLIKPFHLSISEREDLIHFLQSLTSKEFLLKN